jgi:DNA-binding GntR family transcriptional regulator
LADAIEQRVQEAMADPSHPWTQHWPAAPDMAAEFGTSRKTIYKSLEHLGGRGVLVKVWMDRPRHGRAQVWVPPVRALTQRPPPSREQIAAEIEKRGRKGEWAVLPARGELADHFGVSKPTVSKAIQLLVARQRVVMLRINGKYRWCILPPYQRRNIDPRLTTTAPRVVITDLIRRILAGEFRYRVPPDPTVHERPFLANREIEAQYQVSAPTSGKVRRELVGLGWIVPGERSNTHYRLATRVPPIDRTTHPAPRKPRKKPCPPRTRRAPAIAADLVRRIRAGKYRHHPFPTLVEASAEYHASVSNMQAAFQILERGGWIEFQPHGQGQKAVLKPEFRNPRAQEIAADLRRRIRAGEFNHRRFPGQRALQSEYRTGAPNVQTALAELERGGFVPTFQLDQRGRRPVLSQAHRRRAG